MARRLGRRSSGLEQAADSRAQTKGPKRHACFLRKLPSLLGKIDRWVGEQFTLYGAIRRCGWRHWRPALSELLITLIFALLPLWAPIIALAMFGKESGSIPDTLFDQIKNGELYILAAGLLTPIYYFTFPQIRDNIKTKFTPFPSQQLLILIFMAIVIVAVLAVSATKVQATANGIRPQMIHLSMYLFSFCVLVFLMTLAVRNSLPELVEQAFDEQSRREQQEAPPPGDNLARQQETPVDPEHLIASVLKEHTVQGTGNA